MPSSDKFLTALGIAVAPRTIDSMGGKPNGITIVLSDGTQLKVLRSTVKALRDDEIDAFITQFLGD